MSSAIEEKKRSEQVIAAYIPPSVPNCYQIAKERDDLSAASPIQRAPSTPATHRVEIPAPQENLTQSLHAIINLSDSIKRLALTAAEFEIHDTTEKMNGLKERECEKIIEIAKRINDQKGWDFLKRIAGCFLCSASVVLGGGLVATGMKSTKAAGYSLIGSGLAGIGSMILDDMQANQYLVATLALLSAALGIVGGAMGLLSGSAQNLFQNIILVVSAAVNVAGGSAQCLESWAKFETELLNGELTKLRGMIEIKQEELERTIEEIRFEEKNNDATEAIRQSLNAYQRGIQQIIYQSA